MANKKQASDASIPTIPESHKDPAQRAHLWERPKRADELPTPNPVFVDYAHELPRWIHKGGDQQFVITPEDCEAAKADGWVIDPNDEAK